MNLKVNGKAPEPAEDFGDYRKSPMVLIGDIGRLMSDRIRAKEANPISQKSGRLLLMELAKRDGRTQLDLVNTTHMKAPTISVALQKMEKDGYVIRKPDEYDLRATRVFLTEKGKTLDNTIRRMIRDQEDYAMTSLNEAEKETLVRLLSKIKTTLVSELPEEGDIN